MENDASYLQVTYRHGRPFAAYYYLFRRTGDRIARTRKAGGGILVDYTRGGRPLGLEITAPSMVSLAAVNRVLKGLRQPLLKAADLAPLHAA